MPDGITLRDFYYLLPELTLTAGALVLLVVQVVLPRRLDRWLSWFTLAVLALAALALPSSDGVNTTVARGLVAIDGFAFFFKVLFILAAALTVSMSARYLSVEGARPGEYYFLILVATLGMMFMAGGIDLITLFIGLETMAVPFYILAGYIRPSRRSNEAAMKYFVLGTFSLAGLLVTAPIAMIGGALNVSVIYVDGAAQAYRPDTLRLMYDAQSLAFAATSAGIAAFTRAVGMSSAGP